MILPSPPFRSEVDAVVIGMGWTGSILSRELTKAGLNVVGLERGAMRSPRDDFAIPAIQIGSRCGRHRHGLDRQHPLARADQGGAERRRPRTGRDAKPTR